MTTRKEPSRMLRARESTILALQSYALRNRAQTYEGGNEPLPLIVVIDRAMRALAYVETLGNHLEIVSDQIPEFSSLEDLTSAIE